MFRTENFGRQYFTDIVFGGASVLTFWSLTVYLYVNLYDRTSRSRYSGVAHSGIIIGGHKNVIVKGRGAT